MAPEPRRSRPIRHPVMASVWRSIRFLVPATVALVLVGVGVAGGRALTENDEARAPSSTTVTTTAIATTLPPAVSPSTTLPPATLPNPEAVPADAYAPTPDVIHGTLALPSIGVEQDLHEGITLTAIDRGPTHWPGTAMPGEIGNVVVAGHRVTHTQPFRDLDRLQPGDPLVFKLTDGTRSTYELTSIEIVAPDAMHIIDQGQEPTATLFACHPKGSAAKRIVAHFRLVKG